jgi:hypothetical protein
MKFYSNRLNGRYLRSVLPDADDGVDWVKAAIAYGSDAETLLRNCLDRKYRLDIWMRYDHTVPVTPQLLRMLLVNVSRNIFCKLIPDVLHSKVIWWKGYGVYVGSANLTDRAWMSNIEFGVFLPEETLEQNGGLVDVEMFFDGLLECESAMQLTQELIDEQEKILNIRRARLAALDDESRKHRHVPEWDGPNAVVTREKSLEFRRKTFIREWEEGLSILRQLAQQAPDFRPHWLDSDVPAAWQADQFLHAYYYNEVVDGARHPFEEHYQKNRADPARAVAAALGWWSGLKEPPSGEDYNCHVRAPVIRQCLTRKNLETLTQENFIQVCQANHSTADHVGRMNLNDFGLEVSAETSWEDRITAFSQWIWARRNRRDERIDKVLAYVLDGGPTREIPSRLFEAANNPERKIPHFGTNQIAEIAGWARREVCAPRNGRTSKSLRALGYDVRIY